MGGLTRLGFGAGVGTLCVFNILPLFFGPFEDGRLNETLGGLHFGGLGIEWTRRLASDSGVVGSGGSGGV